MGSRAPIRRTCPSGQLSNPIELEAARGRIATNAVQLDFLAPSFLLSNLRNGSHRPESYSHVGDATNSRSS
jgi:hypothetical protein